MTHPIRGCRYIDLRRCDEKHELIGHPGQPCKNDSAMWDTYNTYSNGYGNPQSPQNLP